MHNDGTVKTVDDSEEFVILLFRINPEIKGRRNLPLRSDMQSSRCYSKCGMPRDLLVPSVPIYATNFNHKKLHNEVK